MSTAETAFQSTATVTWPPPLEDKAVLAALTDGAVTRAQTETSEIVSRLRTDLSLRAKATVGIALVLREHQDAPLRALLGTAQDLLGPETEEACENVVGLLRAGWSQGVGDLLAAARSL